MSNIIQFPAKQILDKNNFHEKLENLHVECMEHVQKTDEHINATAKKMQLRNLLISKYDIDEQLIDELMEITSELIAYEYDYVIYTIFSTYT
ncbi:MAG: hypothetical protein FWC68_00890 [Oscillospiraceae bacterium]|nr:hypothetical protein [Oscillospiraceae bacterium]